MTFKENWKKKSKKYKALTIARIILSLLVLIFSTIGLVGFMDIAVSNNISIPLIGIIMTLSGIENFKSNKLIAYFSFGVALFIFWAGTTILYNYLVIS